MKSTAFNSAFKNFKWKGVTSHLGNAFGRYVSPEVLQRLRKVGDSMHLTGERKTATVLFSDICGFTALSSTLAPEQIIALLNLYMSLMIEVIARYNGYINKFVGDEIMVIFNVPLNQKDHVAYAVACSHAKAGEVLLTRESVRVTNHTFSKQKIPRLKVSSTGKVKVKGKGSLEFFHFKNSADELNRLKSIKITRNRGRKNKRSE